MSTKPISVQLATLGVGGGELPMSGTWRRILTVKMLALSALILAFVVIAIIHRRHVDARASLPQRHGYPPHVKAGW